MSKTCEVSLFGVGLAEAAGAYPAQQTIYRMGPVGARLNESFAYGISGGVTAMPVPPPALKVFFSPPPG
jgi:hypothetical protein